MPPVKQKRGPRGPYRKNTTWFWSKIDKLENGCWKWTGAKTHHGYAQVAWGGKSKMLHRVMMEFVSGPLPDGLNVCHHCDNPLCVRPDHLFLGTQKDNLADMTAKGRRVSTLSRAEKNGGAVLSWKEVREIRAKYAAGRPTADIAREHNRHYYTVRDVITGRTWKEDP